MASLLRRSLLLVSLSLCGCYSPTNPTLATPSRAKSLLAHRAWVKTVRITDPLFPSKGRYAFERRFTAEFTQFLMVGGWFREATEITESDWEPPGQSEGVILSLEVERFKQVRQPFVLAIPLTVATLLTYVILGGPTHIDTSHITGRLIASSPSGTEFAVVETTIKDRQFVSADDQRLPLDRLGEQPRTRFAVDLMAQLEELLSKRAKTP